MQLNNSTLLLCNSIEKQWKNNPVTKAIKQQHPQKNEFQKYHFFSEANAIMEFDKYDICVSEKHFEEICESFPRNSSEFHRISVLASICQLWLCTYVHLKNLINA